MKGRQPRDLRWTLILAWPVFAGCATTTVDVMLGQKLGDGGFYGSGPTATLRIRHAVTARTWCEYEHVSHLLVGRPFGDPRDEDSLDQLGCGIRFGGE